MMRIPTRKQLQKMGSYNASATIGAWHRDLSGALDDTGAQYCGTTRNRYRSGVKRQLARIESLATEFGAHLAPAA